MRSLLVACALSAMVASAASSEPVDLTTRFADFKAKYDRRYSTEAEEAKRFATFAANMQKAEKLNALNPKATFGSGPFADYTEAEFKSYHSADAYFKGSTQREAELVHMSQEEKARAAGQSIDWRQHGAVTGVKNQEQAECCYAFSATGNIEGQWKLAGHELTSLSEQEIASCDTIDNGCNGGLMQNVFRWLLEARNGQIATEKSYPFVAGNDICPRCNLNGKTVGATISGQLAVAHNEDDMASWVYKNGPLSIGVDATSWQTYNGGIMTNCISQQMDHGVLIVGFDDSNYPPYWIVKNSWGPGWGEEGYIRVKKGSNECLITGDPVSSKV